MSNRLKDESSPYLRQHADNPVDWFPWGDEPFEVARTRGVPVFLSVGYSSCHWCHVMARESFEDLETGSFLNRHFVSIKVDREERPEIDALYMSAIKTMTRTGGWPMSVFLTDDGRPFYAGSYWPLASRSDAPSFKQVLTAVHNAWSQQPDRIAASVESVDAALSAVEISSPRGPEALDPELTDGAAALVLERHWDREYGGFGDAPKFPNAMIIEWLLHRHARNGDNQALASAVQALEAMMCGGVHDQIGGGFARYAIDRQLRIPHFEKMLYDNALLLPSYAAAAVLTDNAAFADVAHSTAQYLLGELRASSGAFYAAMDADSEDAEGVFYIWSYSDLVECLSDTVPEASEWAAFLGATPEGNWNGTNVLYQSVSIPVAAKQAGISEKAFRAELVQVRNRLLAERSTRISPRTDDKILTDWNALAARGLIRGGMLLDEPNWIEAAAKLLEFLHTNLIVRDRLFHSWKDGVASVDALLLDHASLALANLELFQATGKQIHFQRGARLATSAQLEFQDEARGGWFQTSQNAPSLYRRLKDTDDEATPSGTAVMSEVCLQLAGLTGDRIWTDRAESGLKTVQIGASLNPMSHGWALRQFESLAAGLTEVVIVGKSGPARDALIRVTANRPRPGTMLAIGDPDHPETPGILADRPALNGSPIAYVCRNSTCARPVSKAADLAQLLNKEAV